MRLQKFLARAGVASRRHSEQLILDGRVIVNGQVVRVLGTRISPDADVVVVDGERIALPEACAYHVLYKPAGYLTSMHDPQGRPTVAELLPAEEGLFPVGRLDMDTTGALIVTSDGALAHKLMHPSFHAPKVYRVTVEGVLAPDDVRSLASGIMLDDGMTRAADVEVVHQDGSSSVVMVALREGRKRQVKRMFDAIGHPVTKLHRESFGPIGIVGMAPGEIRALTQSEVRALKDVVGVE